MPSLAQLKRRLAELDQTHARRRRRVVDSPCGVNLEVEGRPLISFASNDYLGLANHKDIVSAARQAIDLYGVGAGASHLITGHFRAHEQLERRLASFVGLPRALLFSTGYQANLGILTALAGRDDAIFGDRLNHACLNDGAVLSRAQLLRYRHNDVAHLQALLEKTDAKVKLICTDAVFSMDGDIAPLADMLKLADAHDAWLVVDDAHGFGVLGSADHPGTGTLAYLGLKSSRIVYMGTLGKAAGVAGAFVAGETEVVDWLMQRARTYIFTTAAPPALAAAAKASIDLIASDPGRVHTLAARIQYWKKATMQADFQKRGWHLLPSSTAIQPLIIGENRAALDLADRLWSRGYWVPAIRPPTVPEGQARLRITLSAAHSEADIDGLAAALEESMQ